MAREIVMFANFKRRNARSSQPVRAARAFSPQHVDNARLGRECGDNWLR